MREVTVGSSGLKVSEVVLGCMGFGRPGVGRHGWAVGEDDARTVIRRAVESGVTTFDTANVYSAGASEEIVGRALGDFARREEVIIATKVHGRMGPGPNGGGLSRGAIMTQVEASLRRLRTDYIDLYQIHRWDPAVPIEETMAALHDLVASGKVRYLGASSMYAWQFVQAQYVARLAGGTPFVSMQDQYNLLQREAEREMLPACLDRSVGVIVWSPLARGKLTRPWDARTSRSRSDQQMSRYESRPEAGREIVEAVAAVAAERAAGYAQIALAWLARRPAVTAAIVGATSPDHLDQALGSLEIELTAEEIARLEAPYVSGREREF